MLTHRICGAVIGAVKPDEMATTMTRACATLVGSMKRIAFSMLLKTVRPSLTAAVIEAKLSSASTISAASFATSVPLIPMATPMSAFLSGGRIVDPVAGHRHDLLVRLDRLHEAELVLGARAGEYVDVADPLLQRRGVISSISAPVSAVLPSPMPSILAMAAAVIL